MYIYTENLGEKIFAFVDLKNYLSKPNHLMPSSRVKCLVSQPELFRNNDFTAQANCQWLTRENGGKEWELLVQPVEYVNFTKFIFRPIKP